MLSAILFDRYYLKRYSSNHLQDTSSGQNRIIDTSPSLLPYPRNCQFPINPSDVPPQYPGYLDESNSIKVENETVQSSRLIYTDINNHNNNNNYTNSRQTLSNNNSSEVKNDNWEAISCVEGKQQLPPNYFDLYPTEVNNNSVSIPSTSTSTTSTMTTPSNEQ